MNQNAGQKTGFSCLRLGCIALLPVIALAIWIGSGLIIWKQCRVPLPDGSGEVVYMAKQLVALCGEYDRKIIIHTNNIKDKECSVPMDTAGGSPVNVYWYPSDNNNGPYFRFVDPLSEYFVDLRRGTTFEVTKYPESGSAVEKELARVIGLGAGTYIGRIEHSYVGFIPASQAPEMKIVPMSLQ